MVQQHHHSSSTQWCVFVCLFVCTSISLFLTSESVHFTFFTDAVSGQI